MRLKQRLDRKYLEPVARKISARVRPCHSDVVVNGGSVGPGEKQPKSAAQNRMWWNESCRRETKQEGYEHLFNYTIVPVQKHRHVFGVAGHFQRKPQSVRDLTLAPKPRAIHFHSLRCWLGTL